MRVMSVENCLGEEQIVQVDTNFTSDLSKDCILTTNGCYTSLGFKQAKVIYCFNHNSYRDLESNFKLSPLILS